MNTIDLFCGCGGLSLGFMQSGFNIIAALDNWKAATDCYKDNFDHPVLSFDLSEDALAVKEIAKISKNKIDMIIGGPPCQDFSHAGMRSEGDRASLTISFANIVTSISPNWFVMENVDRALKSETYKQAKKIFQENGYGLTEIVLDASKCNVPQKRKRLFVIGLLHAENDFLTNSLLSNQASTPMTIRDYLGDQLGLEYYYRHPRNYNRRGIFSIDEPSPTIRGVNRPVPKGYEGHPNDPISIDTSVRPLTTKERTLLQTFPTDFKFQGSKTTIEQLIGNAVPVNLAKFVADTIKGYIQEKKLLSNLEKYKNEVVENNV